MGCYSSKQQTPYNRILFADKFFAKTAKELLGNIERCRDLIREDPDNDTNFKTLRDLLDWQATVFKVNAHIKNKQLSNKTDFDDYVELGNIFVTVAKAKNITGINKFVDDYTINDARFTEDLNHEVLENDYCPIEMAKFKEQQLSFIQLSALPSPSDKLL